GTITIELDGRVVVRAPLEDLVEGKTGAPFVYPLVADADQSSGGVYIKVPMPYRESMRITTENNPFFYHVTYRKFASSEGIETFDRSDRAHDVIAKLRAAGTTDPKPPQPNERAIAKNADVPPSRSAVLAQCTGSGAVTELALRLPQLRESDGPAAAARVSDDILARARLRIRVDGRRTVDAPLGEFFGSGLGLVPVRSLMFAMDPETKTLRSWWLMPYAESVSVELYNGSAEPLRGVQATTTISGDPAWKKRLDDGRVGRFRTTTNRELTPPGRDHVFLDTTGTGRVVGVVQTIEGRNAGKLLRAYLEGDERLFVDGSASPDVHGTGTEDFYEGGWYFNRGTFTAPMTGNPAHERYGDGCRFDCTGLYRLLLAEGFDFSSKVRFGIEHGLSNTVEAIEGSTTFWYGDPAGRLAWTDTLDVGDPESERAHAYTSGEQTTVVTATGRFGGIDGPPEPVAHDGRSTTKPVRFRLAVAEDNQGVILRRISSQETAYQTARVTVDGVDAGVWMQPMNNPHRRWLDDFYELPANLTRGERELEITLTPVRGAPAWDAAAYHALSRKPAGTGVDGSSLAVGLSATPTGRPAGHRAGRNRSGDPVYEPRYAVEAWTSPELPPSWIRHVVGRGQGEGTR
ncbi:MAG TPA: glycoside hydrolase family 172 protein, partial [Actinopolymorphaceae bacterium]